MGFIRVCAYIITVLIAILAYFHMECIKEKEAEEKISRFEEFKPGETHCNVELSFVTMGKIKTRKTILKNRL